MMSKRLAGQVGRKTPIRNTIKSIRKDIFRDGFLPGLMEDEREVGRAAESAALASARQEYRGRRDREKIFGPGLFADPVWDILLDLFVACGECRQVPVTSACIAAVVPSSTALRHIAHMHELGLVQRTPHPTDSRCQYLSLTHTAYARMLSYFARGQS